MQLRKLAVFCSVSLRRIRLPLPALVTVMAMLYALQAQSQGCPANIDFETGTFDGWTCYTGYTSSVSDQNIISLSVSGPTANRHTMYTNSVNQEYDPYGNFPVNCPNGSKHSIRLGNDQGGGEAEGVSYEFTIPSNKNVYSLIYHYAVVFQDPNHLESQQPRMEVEITNVTDDIRIDCSSFTFHPYGSVLPGFQLSPNPGSSTPVWYKDWSAVTINLNNMAGKTIRLFFKTADCTFKKHFGYAYVDVNSECSGDFTGAAFCPNDSAVTVLAPYGYEGYRWFNSDFTQVIGNAQSLVLSPAPATGTRIAVELTPYNGYGCQDTLYANLLDTLTVNAFAGPDTFTCNKAPVQIGYLPRPGIRYRWSPADGLSDATTSNPYANPNVSTQYILTASSSGGGCVSYDTVFVRADLVGDSLRMVGKASYCITSGDSTILSVTPADVIQWYQNSLPLAGANQPTYHVKQSGTYYATLMNYDGCGVTTDKKVIAIDVPKPGMVYPVKYTTEDFPLALQARAIGVSALWSPASNLNNAAVFSPQFSGNEDQVYTVAITAGSGCVAVDTQQVKIISRIDIYVPNGFTPNHDGNNELLRPLLRGIRQLHYFRVYNRAGKLVFQTSKELEGWDGTIGGHEQTTQTFVWVVEGIGVDNKLYQKTGTTVLIR